MAQPLLSRIVTEDDLPWINVKTYGAYGDGRADDTVAIAAAIAAMPGPGYTLFFPRGTYLTSATIAVPDQCGVAGTNHATGSVIRGTTAGMVVMTVGSSTNVMDLKIDGNLVAANGLLTRYQANKPHYARVRVEKCTEGGFVYNGTQNMVSIDCIAQYNKRNYWILNGTMNTKFLNCNGNVDDLYGGTVDSRNVVIANAVTAGVDGTIAYGLSNRAITFFGGIFERGPGDYCIDILNAYTYISFIDVEFNNGTIAAVHIGPDFGDHNVYLTQCTFALNATNLAVKAESGRVHRTADTVRDTSGLGTRYIDDIFQTTGAGMVQVGLESNTRRPNLLHQQAAFFDGGVSGWGLVGTGTLTYDATKKRGLATANGVANGFRWQFDGTVPSGLAYRYLRLSFLIPSVTVASGTSLLVNVDTIMVASPFRRVITSVLAGENSVLIPLVGDEVGFGFFAGQAVLTTWEMQYVLAELL